MKTVHSSLATAVILSASFATQSQTLPPDMEPAGADTHSAQR